MRLEGEGEGGEKKYGSACLSRQATLVHAHPPFMFSW
jgi:hypothetical protein